eukprot:CAMPEP_0119016622 /NCGR_PEP_ID=MMETSP1176-20130426/13848_1 /TAXON_ID=265551 /ORGANISM="Synedropsis recta cf, Strain CCMP1620" /LENGTH=341 /DNA_ID=CAMNT_0006970105 /DNA_START=110 /DNA_END=1135 /DNA_ORIENTATION=-
MSSRRASWRHRQTRHAARQTRLLRSMMMGRDHRWMDLHTARRRQSREPQEQVPSVGVVVSTLLFLNRPPAQREGRGDISWERDLITKGVLPDYLSDYSMERVLCQDHVLSITTGDFRHERLFLKRIRAMTGWAVHGLVFEFVDETRAGYIVGPSGRLKRHPTDRYTKEIHLSDRNIQRRGGASDWVSIEPGDYIVEITGFDLAQERQYLCHSITLTFASGRIIDFSSDNETWKGQPFQFRTSNNNLLPFMPIFYDGGCHGMTSLQTSINLPFTRQNAQFYPNRDALLNLLKVFNRIDSQHLEKSLGKDVWWHILEMLHSRDLAPYHPPTATVQQDVGAPVP